MTRAMIALLICAMPMLAVSDNTAPVGCGRETVGHSGDLNSCGCHIDHRTGVCHCHRAPACGC